MSLFSEKFPTHCMKFRDLTYFPDVEILWKDTASAEICVISTKLCGNCKFPQYFHTRKLGEVTVIYVVTRVMQL